MGGWVAVLDEIKAISVPSWGLADWLGLSLAIIQNNAPWKQESSGSAAPLYKGLQEYQTPGAQVSWGTDYLKGPLTL